MFTTASFHLAPKIASLAASAVEVAYFTSMTPIALTIELHRSDEYVPITSPTIAGQARHGASIIVAAIRIDRVGRSLHPSPESCSTPARRVDNAAADRDQPAPEVSAQSQLTFRRMMVLTYGCE